MKGENFVQLTKKIYKVSASNVIKSVRTVALPKSIVGELDMSGKVYGTHVEIMGAPPPGSRFLPAAVLARGRAASVHLNSSADVF